MGASPPQLETTQNYMWSIGIGRGTINVIYPTVKHSVITMDATVDNIYILHVVIPHNWVLRNVGHQRITQQPVVFLLFFLNFVYNRCHSANSKAIRKIHPPSF